MKQMTYFPYLLAKHYHNVSMTNTRDILIPCKACRWRKHVPEMFRLLQRYLESILLHLRYVINLNVTSIKKNYLSVEMQLQSQIKLRMSNSTRIIKIIQ